MHIGLVLPRHGGWERVVQLASGAERLGVGSLWFADPPGGAAAPADQTLEPLTALAGLARLTTTVRLGALLGPGARSPAVAAKALSTIDVLSGGRVVVALQAPPDGATAGADAMDESVQVMKGAFGGGPFTFHGQHHRCEGLHCRPLPLQRPAPPIWVSGTGGPLLAVAARHADGWGPPGWGCGVDEYRELGRALDRACRAAGRDPAAVQRFVRREPAPGDSGALAEEVAAWAATGVATLLLGLGAVALPVASGAALGDELEIVESAVSSAT